MVPRVSGLEGSHCSCVIHFDQTQWGVSGILITNSCVHCAHGDQSTVDQLFPACTFACFEHHLNCLKTKCELIKQKLSFIHSLHQSKQKTTTCKFVQTIWVYYGSSNRVCSTTIIRMARGYCILLYCEVSIVYALCLQQRSTLCYTMVFKASLHQLLDP